MANEPQILSPPPHRRWRVALFFIGWTLLAAGATWWLIRADQSSPPRPQLLFDGGKTEPLPLGEQVVRWLKLADLNFRGAYPWVLLAPYVIWLASRFHLERGRMRLSVPIHLAGSALFALGAAALNGRSGDKVGTTIIVSGQTQGLPIPWQLLTNRPGAFGSAGPLEGHLNFQMRTSYVSGVSSKGGIATSQSGMATSFSSSAGGSASFSSARTNAQLFSHLLNVLAYASLVGLAQAVHFQRRYRERERRAVLLESNLAKARLHALQAQLHPHFLFNALNAVATLLRRDPRLASEALTSFSELLRLALSQSDKQEISLRDDLLFLERYVDIQKIRLGERFRFELDVDAGLLDCLVPSLLLQPLVENALRHGIEPSANPGTVRVNARHQGERLVIRIEDNGIGLGDPQRQPGGTGIGLTNLRARLETLYGSEQKLELSPRPGGGVLVQLEIPLRRNSVTA